MRTLLWFLGIATIIMGLVGIVAIHMSIAYLGLIGMGAVSVLLGFRSPEEL
jgi:hypothetical protein